MKHFPLFYKCLFIILIVFVSTASLYASGSSETKDKILNIYAARNYASDEIAIAQFENVYSATVNVISGNPRELIARLSAEQENTPADILIAPDAGALTQAQHSGFLQPISSSIGSFIPSKFKANDNSWIGFTKRARVLIYDPLVTDPTNFPTYESLATRSDITIATRSSANAYNVSLIASRIAELGTDQTIAWVAGLVNNFAREPQGNDRGQIKLVASGNADVAISNSYYLGLMIHSQDPAERAIGESLRIWFPNQDSSGTHMNISGAGLIKYTKNKELAEKFIEYLLSEQIQELYTNENYEYPVNPAVPPGPTVASWGSFKESNFNLSDLRPYLQEAINIASQNGWY